MIQFKTRKKLARIMQPGKKYMGVGGCAGSLGCAGALTVQIFTENMVFRRTGLSKQYKFIYKSYRMWHQVSFYTVCLSSSAHHPLGQEKSAFDHAQHAQIQFILCMCKVSSEPFLSIYTFCPIILLADGEGPDQTTSMRGLI